MAETGENLISSSCLLEVPLVQGSPRDRPHSDSLSKSRDSGSQNSFFGGTGLTDKNGSPSGGNDISDQGNLGNGISGQPILSSGRHSSENGGETIKNRSLNGLKRSTRTGNDSLMNLKSGSTVSKDIIGWTSPIRKGYRCS